MNGALDDRIWCAFTYVEDIVCPEAPTERMVSGRSNGDDLIAGEVSKLYRIHSNRAYKMRGMSSAREPYKCRTYCFRNR